MKSILIYGDSNVWGDNSTTNKRIPYKKRWTNILEKKLKKNFKIYAEGLPGRLAGEGNLDQEFKNGKKTFEAILRSVCPIDIIIISLGTNDLLMKYNKKTEKIIEDLEWYTNIINLYNNNKIIKKKYFNNKKPKIIYIMPSDFEDIVNKTANEIIKYKRQQIICYFEKNKYNIVIPNGVTFFKDKIHLNYNGHKVMANLVFNYIEEVSANENCYK